MISLLKKKKPEPWTSLGRGVHLDRPDRIMELGYPDSFRKGHFWCFGTTRVGKTRIMEHIIDQDIRKGYSVVAIDPKGDADLFSKIVQVAFDTGRQEELILISPVFPEFSAILDLLSSYYMIEEQGQEIPAEFLTLEGSLDFFRIGAVSGFKEGLFLILLFPVFSFYLLPFVFKTPDLSLTITLNTIPYFPVIINTMLCIYISRYYVGNLTRKAVNSLFVGRATLLVAKAGFIYIAWYMLVRLSTPERVWAVAQHFNYPEQVYSNYLEILPHMMPVAVHCSLIILIASIVPYGSVYVLDHWRRYKIRKNHQIIGR